MLNVAFFEVSTSPSLPIHVVFLADAYVAQSFPSSSPFNVFEILVFCNV
jgi:hypothetical protein